MEVLSTIAEVGNKYIWSFPDVLPWIIVVLLGAGFLVTARLAFIQLRRVGHAIRVVLGHYDDPDDPGDVSHFAALSTALSATVGIGNIGGVATAIHYGGPGAVFWMWVTAIFGMALKFAECTLAIKYRDFDDKGEVAGGPMYYIERGLGKNWKPLAIFFAGCGVLASMGSGNMVQSNTVAVSAASDFGVTGWVVGLILAVAVGAIIIGGIRNIAKVASTLAPSMAALYILGAITILIMNAGDVPGAFGEIVSSAFTPKASIGGSVAGTLSLTLLWGVKRGLFSNEAGQGSAPIAHASAKTEEPVREGAVAMLGPLIDTLIICTMTALVITVTGVWDKKRTDSVPLSETSFYAVGDHRDDADVRLPERIVVPATAVTVVAGTESGTVQFKAPQKIEVGSGTITGEGLGERRYVAVARDGIVQSGVIVDNKGKRYDAVFKVKRDGSSLVPDLSPEQANLGLVVKGDMLRNSSALTAWGFEEGLSPLGDWGNYVVTFCVFLFALSTMVSWSYYGDRCITYLVGSRGVIPYRLVFIAAVFCGAVLQLEVVWAYGDIALGLMTVPNLIAVVLLLPKVVEMSRDYFARMDKGEGVPKKKGKGDS